jgi:hypothetical protein
MTAPSWGTTQSPRWPPDADPLFRPTLIVASAASVGVMVGSISPWLTVGVFTVNGLDAGNWGVTGLTLGAVSGLALTIIFFWPRTSFDPRWAVPLAWLVAVDGVACVGFALPTLIRIMASPKPNVFGIPIGPSVGWGLWLLAFGAAVLCIAASIAATRVAQYVDTLRPFRESQTAWTNGWRWAAIIISTIVVLSEIVYFWSNWGDNSERSDSSPMGLPSDSSLPSFTMPSFPSFPTTSTTTTTATSTVAVDPESDSLNRLRAIATDDRFYAMSSLDNRWIAQISSKRAGLRAEGITWNYVQILREHLQLRQQYPGARLLWSGDWSSFSAPDFWVTVVGPGFEEKSGAQAWCTVHSLDQAHCFANLVSVSG